MGMNSYSNFFFSKFELRLPENNPSAYAPHNPQEKVPNTHLVRTEFLKFYTRNAEFFQQVFRNLDYLSQKENEFYETIQGNCQGFMGRESVLIKLMLDFSWLQLWL